MDDFGFGEGGEGGEVGAETIWDEDEAVIWDLGGAVLGDEGVFEVGEFDRSGNDRFGTEGGSKVQGDVAGRDAGGEDGVDFGVVEGVEEGLFNLGERGVARGERKDFEFILVAGEGLEVGQETGDDFLEVRGGLVAEDRDGFGGEGALGNLSAHEGGTENEEGEENAHGRRKLFFGASDEAGEENGKAEEAAERCEDGEGAHDGCDRDDFAVAANAEGRSSHGNPTWELDYGRTTRWPKPKRGPLPKRARLKNA